jgi:hypothetical protein
LPRMALGGDPPISIFSVDEIIGVHLMPGLGYNFYATCRRCICLHRHHHKWVRRCGMTLLWWSGHHYTTGSFQFRNNPSLTRMSLCHT